MEKKQENNDIRISSGINLSDDISEAIEELRNMSNEEVDTLMSNTNIPLFTNFNPLAKLNNEEHENPFDLNEIERIYRDAKKHGTILKILDKNEYKSYPIIHHFFEEKLIPSEREFKDEAKKLKVSGNFSSLGAAQNALAKKYGFKEYRAIKNCFKNSDILNIVKNAINLVNELKPNNFEVAVNELHKLLKEYNNIIIESNLFENIDNIDKKIYIKINNKRVAQALGYFDIGRDYFLFYNDVFIVK